jgi:hypothetical protein
MSFKKRITLTEKGVDSGPLYGVYSSPDGNTFSFIENVVLPSVGSKVTITFPDNAVIMKLTSLGICNNSVIQVIPNTLGGDFNIDFSYYDFNVY